MGSIAVMLAEMLLRARGVKIEVVPTGLELGGAEVDELGELDGSRAEEVDRSVLGVVVGFDVGEGVDVGVGVGVGVGFGVDEGELLGGGAIKELDDAWVKTF